VITKVWYSVQNGGDGSAYPQWFESEALATFDQDNMDEGWGECCTGSLDIEHEGPIKILDNVITCEKYIEQLEESLSYASYPKHKEDLLKQIAEVKGLIAQRIR